MIRLRSVTLREITLPLREPFVISSGVQDLRRILLLELVDVDGPTAWSECVAQELPNYSSETIDTAWHALTQWLIPLVLDRRITPENVFDLLEEDIRGHQMAKGALEMGIWALQAEKEGVSLAALLDRHSASLDDGDELRTQVPVGISIGIQPSPQALIEKVRTCMAEGYQKIKTKIRPGADLDYLRAVREAYGDELPLAADANAAYRLSSDLDALRAIDELNLIMLEQPLQHDDLVRHAALQKELATPICLDESITSLERAEDMIHLASGRIINVKPGRVGGFTASLAIHDLCADNDLPVWCGGMLESGVGRAHNVALASLPNFRFPGDLSPSRRYWERDIVSPEWTMTSDGRVDVPLEKTGLGVEVDVDRIAGLTKRMEQITA